MSPEATPSDSMVFAAGISGNADPSAAVQAVLKQTTASLKGKPAHAAFLFVSSLYRTEWAPLLKKIRQELGSPVLLGCTGGGVLGPDKEMERMPAVSLAAAYLPRVKLHPFIVRPRTFPKSGKPAFGSRRPASTRKKNRPASCCRNRSAATR